MEAGCVRRIVEDAGGELPHIAEQVRYGPMLDQDRVFARRILRERQYDASRSQAQGLDLGEAGPVAIGIDRRLDDAGQHRIVVAADGAIPVAPVADLRRGVEIIDRRVARGVDRFR